MENNDFDRIISGTKQIASYYKGVNEPMFHDDTSQFDKLCSVGKMNKIIFFIKNTKQNFRIVYKAYAKSDQAWRLRLYKDLKKIGQNEWNDDLEKIERIILGY